MGRAAFQRLVSMEEACHHEGLHLDGDQSVRIAPWHLPDGFEKMPAMRMPSHPLLDRQWMLAVLHSMFREPTAAHALQWVLDPASLEQRAEGWQILRIRSLVASRARIAIVLHAYYPEVYREIVESLEGLSEPWDLYVTAPHFAACPKTLKPPVSAWNAWLSPGPNRGRDVLPWLRLLAAGVFDDYELVCKLHTKKSPHMSSQGEEWRRSLVDSLVGDPAHASEVLSVPRGNPAVGVLGSLQSQVLPNSAKWRGSVKPSLMRRVLGKVGVDVAGSQVPFFAGTMFWFRPEAVCRLKALVHLPFEHEMGQTDGTTAHAVERIIGACARAEGFSVEAL